MRIAYQGEPGAFSEMAARQVSPDAEPVPCRNFEDVFDVVKRGQVDYGILPIENSVGGSIHRNFDLLLEHEIPIVGEEELPVVHHLLALPGTTIEQVRRIYSHPQALAQCDRFLRAQANVEVIATYDTAGSAKLIADEGMRDAAAIASQRAAEVFGLVALRSSIQDYQHNVTRFLIVGDKPLSPKAPDKTTIVFTLSNEPGALFKALAVFALRGIDLTKLESRPYPGRRWEYLFYVDVAAAKDDLACTRALTHLSEFASMLRVLGSYASCRTQLGDRPIVQDFPQVSDPKGAHAS
ncbi:MAG: prephenate dehydratase [Vicinamibacterales bacterium]